MKYLAMISVCVGLLLACGTITAQDAPIENRKLESFGTPFPETQPAATPDNERLRLTHARGTGRSVRM